MQYSDDNDQALAEIMKRRAKDWRMGAVVYQVLVDRFAPCADLDAKQHLYAAPKTLHNWHEKPSKGHYLSTEQLWSHEIAFWGGDLQSLRQNLAYVCGLNVDVLYLNPIHVGYTNHKYDSLDFKEVSPEFGCRADVIELADTCHQQGLKLVLDGVFNHMGQNATIFKDALQNANSPYRDWFYFSEQYQGGYLAWENARNLPELNLENPEVQQYIYADKDSVVQKYISEGVDGWRLDVAHDIGYNYLKDITQAAHSVNAQALVVGEVWCYPSQWVDAMDGLMNFSLRQIVLNLCQGKLDAAIASQMFEHMLADSDYEGLLKSWLILDNHDTSRIQTLISDDKRRRLAQVLHFTLPGSPNVFYGSELGMDGGEDPEMRGPMRWDWVNDENLEMQWHKQLIDLHQFKPALKYGNTRSIASKHLFAFERYTDKVAESVFIVINPNDEEIEEMLLLRNAKLMNMRQLDWILASEATNCALNIIAGTVHIKLPARGFAILMANTEKINGYTTYKRVS